MAVKTFTSEILTSSDTNTYLANSGLVYVTSATVGTGVSSVSIANCFNSTYRNYRVTFEGGTQSANDLAVQLQFANTANHYASQRYDAFNGVGAGTLASFAQTFAYFSLSAAANQATFSIDVYAPFATEVTKYSGSYTSNNFYGTGGGLYFATTSLTGFSIIWPSCTNTGGTVTVYGYRKA
jgi:hypothetical protein